MYAWIWRTLPGPWPVRTVIALAFLTAVLVALFLWVFPWIEDVLDLNTVVVG